MPEGPVFRLVVGGVVAVLVVTAFVPAAGGGVSAGSARQADADEPSPVNFTVTWRASENTTGSPQAPGNPQAPGAGPVDVQAFARGFPVHLTPIGNLTIVRPGPKANITTCQAIDKPSGSEGIEDGYFGIDRNDDSSSTNHSDITLGDGDHEVFWRFTREDGLNTTWVDFWDEGEGLGFGDDSVDLFTKDEVVLELPDCLEKPSKRGWYRWYGYLNGSNDGDPDDTGGGDWSTEHWWGDDPDESAAVYSHWYYVCECENRTDAERTLGVPTQYHPDRNASVGAPNYVQDGQARRDLDLRLYSPGDNIGRPPAPTEPPTPTAAPTATPTETSTPSPPTPTSGDSPGFGVVGALSAVGAVVVFLSRRL